MAHLCRAQAQATPLANLPSSSSRRWAHRRAAPLAREPAAWTEAAAAAVTRRRLTQPRTQQGTVATAAAAPPTGATAAAAQPTLLWYKKDLRLDDHPGWHQALAAAASGAAGPVVPVFVFDPARYAALVLPPGGAEALCRALASLDRGLRQRGSALLVRVGAWEEELPGLVQELGAGGVVAEQEVEADWSGGVAAVAAALGPGVALKSWSAPLLASHADDFRELKRQQPEVLPPVDAPAKLPPLPAPAAEAAGGEGSSAALGLSPSKLRQLAADAYLSTVAPQLRPAASAALGLDSTASAGSLSSFSEDESSRAGALINRLPDDAAGSGAAAPGGSDTGSGSSGRAWEARLAAEIAEEGPVLTTLRRYLRSFETEAEVGAGNGSGSGSGSGDQGGELAAAIAAFDAPATPEGSFPALFSRALALGVVSTRRVYAEASALLQQQPEQAAPAGLNPLALLGWLLTSSGGAPAVRRRQRKAAAAAAAAEARAFHERMAVERQGQQAHGATLHHWRWRGALLTDYLAAPAGGPNAASAAQRPAILLCHGFGAFSEHYRDNVAALAAAGYDVYAPTLPGYGRAEKPALPYGQDLWRDFLADFVLQVVRRPVVAAGNSIGGFISASLAADYPGLVEGLVLLNSAGQLVEGYTPPPGPPAASPPPPFVVDAVSRGLFSFLEGDVANQLRRVYPVRPQRADAWLGREIARAARDPGALGVFRSVFYLPKPRALNYLVAARFAKPALVLQGALDPLNNAPQRADDIARLCPNARVIKLTAGHCPHDEVPEQVNAELLAFVEQRVLPAIAQRGSDGSGSGSSSGGGPSRVAAAQA